MGVRTYNRAGAELNVVEMLTMCKMYKNLDGNKLKIR